MKPVEINENDYEYKEGIKSQSIRVNGKDALAILIEAITFIKEEKIPKFYNHQDSTDKKVIDLVNDIDNELNKLMDQWYPS